MDIIILLLNRHSDSTNSCHSNKTIVISNVIVTFINLDKKIKNITLLYVM